MDPHQDKGKHRQASREEFEVDYYTKELGRPLQRKLLQRRLADVSQSNISAAGHAEEPSPERDASTPREDRAG